MLIPQLYIKLIINLICISLFVTLSLPVFSFFLSPFALPYSLSLTLSLSVHPSFPLSFPACLLASPTCLYRFFSLLTVLPALYPSYLPPLYIPSQQWTFVPHMCRFNARYPHLKTPSFTSCVIKKNKNTPFYPFTPFTSNILSRNFIDSH